MIQYDVSDVTGVMTNTVLTTGAAGGAGTTYYIGDVPQNTYWYWPTYPTYLPPTVYMTGPMHHEHEFEQVRSAEGGYEARLFCKGCGDTKRLRAAK